MRRAALVGTLITFTALVFGLMQVASVGANSASVPALQATATTDADTTATTGTTATADADTTATAGTTATIDAAVTAGTTATADADTTATTGTTATGNLSATVGTTATAGSTATADTTTTSVSQGQLPDTGGSNTPTLTLLVIGTVLVVFGAFAITSLAATRRNT